MVTKRLVMGMMLALGANVSHGETLMDVYQLAIGNDPQFKAAEAGHRAAQEALPQSRANFLPSLTLGARHTEYIDPDYASYELYQLTLTQPLYRQSSFVTRRTAKSSVKQAEYQFTAAQQNLIISVAEAYFGALSARDTLEFATAEKEANARQLEQTKQRFDVGLVAITDVQESQAAYDLSVAQAIAAQNDVDNSLEPLRQITGQYIASLSPLGENMPLVSPDPTDLKQWTKAALEQNPTLQATRETTRQAQEAIDQQRANNYPSLDLVVNYSNTDSVFAKSQGLDSTTALLQLNMSLFEGGATSSAIRQARELFTQSQEQLEQQSRATQAQVRNAYRGVLSGISRVKALKQAVVSNESALRAAEAGYEVGTRTTVDVLNARRNVFGAQRDYAQSRYDYLLNTLRLKQAAGTLAPEDLRLINGMLK
jgi:outer membrane protein